MKDHTVSGLHLAVHAGAVFVMFQTSGAETEHAHEALGDGGDVVAGENTCLSGGVLPRWLPTESRS